MNRFAVIFGFMVAVFCGTVSGQALWGGAEYGMTVDQVLKVIPDARAPEKGDTLGSGAIEKLRRNSVIIIGKTFRAGFFFDGQNLQQVTLSPTQQLTGAQAEVVFDGLVDALRTKYGKEISKKNQTGLMRMRDYTWLSERTNISAVLLIIGDSAPIINISYQVRLAKEADSL